MAVEKTRKKLSDAPTPKKATSKVEEKPVAKKVAKTNGKAAATAPAPVKAVKKAAKVPEPTKKYNPGQFKVDSPEMLKQFPEMKGLIPRLKKEGYDNFYMFFSFTPAGVANPKVKRIGFEMKYNAPASAK